MEAFYRKKSWFGILFLGFVIGFAVWNWFSGAGEIRELWKSFVQAETAEEIVQWTAEVEEVAGEEIAGRMNFIEAYGYMQNLLGKREFNSFYYVKDDDGMMYYGAVTDLELDDLEIYAQRVYRMKEYVESTGARFIVVLPAAKILYGVGDVPGDWPVNDPNARMDKFLKLLMGYGVHAIDTRIALRESGESLEDLFFRTDHHWTPLAAFYATRELVNQIRETYGDDWDPDGYYTDLKHYHTKFYEDCMLGSTGRNTGAAYSGLDDYLLLWPECDMKFTWENFKEGEKKSGSYTEALFNLDALEISELYRGSVNSVYLDEVVTHDAITNHSNEGGPNLTVLRDSYFSPMACFLAPMCGEIEMVWARNRHHDMDFEEFVKESEADYVILEVYPYNLDADSFAFFQDAGES